MGFLKKCTNMIVLYVERVFGAEWVSYDEFWEKVLEDKRLFPPGNQAHLV